jgi:hypothetical protein
MPVIPILDVLTHQVFVMIPAYVLKIPAILLLAVSLTLSAAMTTMLALSILVFLKKDANTTISQVLVMIVMNVLKTGVA